VEVIGSVVRLQVQRSRLKPGPRGARVYDPSPLVEAEALEVGPRGVVGLLAGQRLLDVHHADHPDSRNRGLVNGLSVLPRSHYGRLRARYGPHLVDGIAGESLLLDAPPLTARDLAGHLALEGDDGTVLLGEAAARCSPPWTASTTAPAASTFRCTGPASCGAAPGWCDMTPEVMAPGAWSR
jgi:hypothetical protein